MAKRRFRYDEKADSLIEITNEDEPRRMDHLLYGDSIYEGMQASDGTDISTRTKHREYMKKNGLTTMDDFKQTWADAARERAEFYTGKRGAVSKVDLAHAIQELESKNRRKR